MKKVTITGANGQIGRILRQGLQGFSVTACDLPEVDLRNFQEVTHAVTGHDVVIHLAWDTTTESYVTDKTNPDNALMAQHIYRAAWELEVPRVIVASSIHADDFELRRPDEMLSPYRLPTPKNLYGATKVYIEALGRYYASKGLEVVCLRFGGVRTENKPSNSPGAAGRFLTHKDLVSLVSCCIQFPKINNNFEIIYGISNNTGRIHDISNHINWLPQEDSTKML